MTSLRARDRAITNGCVAGSSIYLVLALADHVFALERGAVFHSGPSQPLLSDLEYRKKILRL